MQTPVNHQTDEGKCTSSATNFYCFSFVSIIERAILRPHPLGIVGESFFVWSWGWWGFLLLFFHVQCAALHSGESFAFAVVQVIYGCMKFILCLTRYHTFCAALSHIFIFGFTLIYRQHITHTILGHLWCVLCACMSHKQYFSFDFSKFTRATAITLFKYSWTNHIQFSQFNMFYLHEKFWRAFCSMCSIRSVAISSPTFTRLLLSLCLSDVLVESTQTFNCLLLINWFSNRIITNKLECTSRRSFPPSRWSVLSHSPFFQAPSLLSCDRSKPVSPAYLKLYSKQFTFGFKVFPTNFGVYISVECVDKFEWRISWKFPTHAVDGNRSYIFDGFWWNSIGIVIWTRFIA